MKKRVPTIKWSSVKKIHRKTKSEMCELYLTGKYFELNALGGDTKLASKQTVVK